MSARRSTRLAARMWWATLPYEGWFAYPMDWPGAPKPPWYAWPLAWLHRIVRRLPGSEPFEPMAPIVCTCDYCQGVPGARFEP